MVDLSLRSINRRRVAPSTPARPYETEAAALSFGPASVNPRLDPPEPLQNRKGNAGHRRDGAFANAIPLNEAKGCGAWHSSGQSIRYHRTAGSGDARQKYL